MEYNVVYVLECLVTSLVTLALLWVILNITIAPFVAVTQKMFSDDQYQDDINTENPLGTGGKLAVIFANLMRNLWSGKERSLSPYKLKVRMHENKMFCALLNR